MAWTRFQPVGAVPNKRHAVSDNRSVSQYLLPSNTKTMCSWKGQASYHTLFVDGGFSISG